ncbi:MAG: indolepyruvate ferredoxin oxidoreductase subunit alpha [Promethearchaeota archaeon]|nr:MAG: indolepyruvate ferredoxin oxidoreductase subunit alpha [Candidatus Lokiarchaeota archaeon]
MIQMATKDTRFTEEVGKVLMLGNEALVRGALEAGVSYISQYPGTPTSDIGESFHKILRENSNIKEYLVHHWAVNEAVATSACAGAAWTGCRSLNPMKHVGLNVASDALSVIALAGPNPGAMVIVVGADPGSLGSHQEQNERFYTWMLHLPCFEPHTPQECKDFTKLAFELSEKYDTVFEIRTSTRSAHSRGYVELGKITKGSAKGQFIRNIPKFNSLPPHAINNHIRLYERIEKIRTIIPELGINKFIPGNNKIGVITSGMPFGYTMEALDQLGLDDVPVLKLGMIYPLNYAEILKFLQGLEKVIVIEELEPFLEVKIAEIANHYKINVEVIGQEYFPKYNEFSTGLVATSLAKIFNKPPNDQMNKAIDYFNSYKDIIPSRFPTFCAGCPERATLYSILKATNHLENTVISGDIGCYVMSFFPPQECSDLVICMSGGLSAAIGMSTKTDQKIIAMIGDSTFFHTGMAPLAEAVGYNSNVLLIIFENSWTAMTGHQNDVLRYLINQGFSIEKICKAIGVQWLKVEDSYNPKKLIKSIEDALETKGLKVIIIKRECGLQAHRWRMSQIKELEEKGEKVQEVVYNITGCQMCYECARILSCPAIRSTEIDGRKTMQIDDDRCIRCGVCYQICPNKAIHKSIIHALETEVPFREL